MEHADTPKPHSRNSKDAGRCNLSALQVAGIQSLLAKLLEEHERCEQEVRALRGGNPTSSSRAYPAHVRE